MRGSRLIQGGSALCRRFLSSMPAVNKVEGTGRPHSVAFSLHRTMLKQRDLLNVLAETLAGEMIRLGSQVPPLIKLNERPWGALASLSASRLFEAGYSEMALPPKVAVVRDAFMPADEDYSTHKLSQFIKALSPSKVAMALEICHPYKRVLVDEYELAGDSKEYRLSTPAIDVHTFMSKHSIQMVHVPSPSSMTEVPASPHSIKQSTNKVMMVAPTAFGFNDQAAQDNTFMNSSVAGNMPLNHRVLEEFSMLHRELIEGAGVQVVLFQHSKAHGTPDACFPNNWFSTHAAGEAAGGVNKKTLVFYPMKCPNRQAERREDIIGVLKNHFGYERFVDMSVEENHKRYFEGTGALVLDRVRGTAYVSLSERANAQLAEDWVHQLGYRNLVTFTSKDGHGGIVYHTNVMMAVGTTVAVVCLESVENEKERKNLMSTLGATHEIVDITKSQMAALCGNVLELENGKGQPVMAMSTRAYNAFTDDQRKVLRKHVAGLHHAPIDTLEHIGGGGVRCTLAELF